MFVDLYSQIRKPLFMEYNMKLNLEKFPKLVNILVLKKKKLQKDATAYHLLLSLLHKQSTKI